MARRKKICRVCGKEYFTCVNSKALYTGDRWQDIACCVEHASEYFAEVYAVRNQNNGVDVNTSDTSEQVCVTDEPAINEFSAEALSEIPAEANDGGTQKKTKKKKQTDEADF